MSGADEILKLKELHEAGAISDEEFAQAKQQILSGIGSGPPDPKENGSRYHVGRAGQIIGEYSNEQIIEMLKDGRLSENDKVYTEGYSNWKNIWEVFKVGNESGGDADGGVPEPPKQTGWIISKRNPIARAMNILACVFGCVGCLTFPWGYCVMATHNSNILDRVVFRIFQNFSM